MINLQKLQDKRIFYILTGSLIILLVLFVTLLDRQKKAKEQADKEQEMSDQAEKQKLPAQPVPKTVFSQYSLETDLPTLPASVKLSDLKTSYTTGEALDYATNLGFKNSVVDEGVNLLLVKNKEEDQETVLSLNKNSGAFLFVSEKGSSFGGSDPTSAARAFLSKMGIWDDTLVVSATYKRESNPGTTYVELHRSWDKLGLPIFNPVGVLNLSESEKLAAVKLGAIENTAPEDPDITWSSDGYTGKMRPNDFNTVTVTVFDDNNNVLSVASNLKILAKTQQKASAETLKSPEEALEEMKSGKVSFSLVKPAGEGEVDLATAFPNNQALSPNASVTEVVLAYLDDLGQKSQSTLYPYYIFRGTTTLDSGYQAQFVQTVPAVKQINTLGVFAQNSQPSVFPGQGNTLQYGTFNWPSPAPNVNNTVACAGLTQAFQVPSGGYIAWYPNTPPRTWYYVPAPGEVVDSARIAELKIELWNGVAQACRDSKIDPTVCGISPDTNLQGACYHVSTGSPFVHVSTTETKNIKMQLAKTTTYADPGLSSNQEWNFLATQNTLQFANGLTRDKLYYEYDKNVFKSVQDSLKQSSSGFLVNKSELEKFVDQTAGELGLNPAEKNSLAVELEREVNKQAGDYVKVGVIDQTTLNRVLPVSILPQPDAYSRLFFFTTEATAGKKLVEPRLEKLSRKDFTVVEIGVLGL